MSSEAPTSLTIATLPAAPDGPEPLPLSLAYDPASRLVAFHHGPHRLSMSCRNTTTRVSRGSRNSESREAVERTDQAAIPCEWLWSWLRYGPGWHPEDRFNEGAFVFDPAARLWHRRWLRRKITPVYHDTHYETIVIDLHLDLVGLRGSHTCLEETETID